MIKGQGKGGGIAKGVFMKERAGFSHIFLLLSNLSFCYSCQLTECNRIKCAVTWSWEVHAVVPLLLLISNLTHKQINKYKIINIDK